MFTGQIEEKSLPRILGFFALLSNPSSNIGHLHLLIQSSGGLVTEGVCLYNFFRHSPVPFTVYNVGGVGSIAAVAFLGAERRKCSATAAFGIHRTRSAVPERATSIGLHSAAEATALDDHRTELILRKHLNLSDDRWKDLENNMDLIFVGEDAKAAGFVDEISDWKPPAGTQILTV